MLGAGGEQLAVYRGVQTAHEDSSVHAGRRVYMYNESYISLGGMLVTLPDGTRQFNAMDNIGSVRLTVSIKDENLSMEHFDYKPFGDTLNAEGESRIGYAAQERDEESRYFAMGARQYDPISGRFLSVDPLYESFPDKTPYHYCNNNPISFKDPSGLSPEGEKGKEDEVQTRYSCMEAILTSLAINQLMEDTRIERQIKLLNTTLTFLDNMIKDEALSSSGGGGGGGRTFCESLFEGEGEVTSYINVDLTFYNAEVNTDKNGIPITIVFNESFLEKFSDNFDLMADIWSTASSLISFLVKIYSSPTGRFFMEGFRSKGLLYDLTYNVDELSAMWLEAYGSDKTIGGLATAKWKYKTTNIEELSRPDDKKYYMKRGNNRFKDGRMYIAFDGFFEPEKYTPDMCTTMAHELVHHWDMHYWSGFMGFQIRFPELRANYLSKKIIKELKK